MSDVRFIRKNGKIIPIRSKKVAEVRSGLNTSLGIGMASGAAAVVSGGLGKIAQISKSKKLFAVSSGLGVAAGVLGAAVPIRAAYKGIKAEPGTKFGTALGHYLVGVSGQFLGSVLGGFGLAAGIGGAYKLGKFAKLRNVAAAAKKAAKTSAAVDLSKIKNVTPKKVYYLGK